MPREEGLPRVQSRPWPGGSTVIFGGPRKKKKRTSSQKKKKDLVDLLGLRIAHLVQEGRGPRGDAPLVEAMGERVRCFVVRCGWSMRRTLCGTSGSCENKGCQRMQLRE